MLIFSFSNVYGQDKGVILATDKWEPYEFQDGKDIKGISTEIVKEVFKRMNIPINSIGIYPWARAEKMLLDKTVDGIFSAAYNEERAKKSKYTIEPIIESSWVFIIKESNQYTMHYEGLDDLKGKSCWWCERLCLSY